MKHWIGVDVSKAHLDVALLDEAGALLAQERISNEPKAVRALLRRWGKEFRLDKSSMLVCLEPTGHYGYRLVEGWCTWRSPLGWLIRWTSSTASVTRGVRATALMPCALRTTHVAIRTKPGWSALRRCA
ncbi:MAG: transposase [Flavobacteriales bacterium]|nr:transposase [Flavobacteriales bacterium]